MDPSDRPLAAVAPEFFARLGQYPQLCGQIAGWLDEMENRAGTCNPADQAEAAVVERIRAMGRLTLTLWAEQRQAAVQPERTPGLCQGGKKKSAG